jgi:serine/threonine-protein kinase
VVVLVAIAVGAWFAFGRDGAGGTVDASPSPTGTLTRPATTVPATPRSTSPSPTPPPTLPGTDALGFLAYPGARCDTGDSPAVLGLTGNSALVVCRSSSGSFYYRGVRLSDGAGIELDGATPSSNGFDVVNPADGTRYRIRPNALTIVSPDNQAFTEPMTEYASSQGS